MYTAEFDLNGGNAPANFSRVQRQDAGAEDFRINNTVAFAGGIAAGGFQNVREANPADISVDLLRMSWPGTPVRTGYIFDGWRNTVDDEVWLEANFDQRDEVNRRRLDWNNGMNPNVSANGRVVFEAVWTSAWDVEFNLNRGPGENIIVPTRANTPVIRPSAPTTGPGSTVSNNPLRPGYTFGGWYTGVVDSDGDYVFDAEGNAMLGSEYNFNAPVNEAFTLFASWGIPNIFTIDLDLNGGTLQEGSVSTSYTVYDEIPLPGAKDADGEYIVLPPTRDGFHFGGWYDTPDFSDEPVEVVKEGSYGDKEFFAKWVFLISFNTNGGTLSASAPTAYMPGDTVSLPAPTRVNYNFRGWFENPALTGQPATVISDSSIGDKEFWAGWTIETNSITYMLSGGANPPGAPSSFTYLSPPITLPTAPTREGFTFGGWFDNADFEGNAITVIPTGSSGSRVFYAKWNENTGNTKGSCGSVLSVGAVGSIVLISTFTSLFALLFVLRRERKQKD
jgi:uncharacterized repeat protein (TIGR02543 family)